MQEVRVNCCTWHLKSSKLTNHIGARRFASLSFPFLCKMATYVALWRTCPVLMEHRALYVSFFASLRVVRRLNGWAAVILQALMPRKFDLLGQEIFEQHHYLKGGLPTAMWGLLVRDEQMFLVNISPADIC